MAEQKKSDLFDKGNKQSNSNFVDWKEIGQRVVGTLVGREIRPNRLQPGTYQEVYTLVQDDGDVCQIAGRMTVENEGKKVKIIGGLHNLKMGAYVGVEYAGDKDVNQPQPAKILEVYHNGTMKKDVLEKYMGVAAGGSGSEEKELPDFK